MKVIFTFLASMTTLCQLLIGCSCIGNSFCSNLEKFTDNDNDLVFMGSFIQSEELEGIFSGLQFKVEKIYYGDIITPDSPLYGGEHFINSDTTVWIFSGNSAICMPDINLNQSAILSVSYKNNVYSTANEFGYATHVCDMCYLPVSESGMVSGWITEPFVDEEMSIEEFEDFFNNNCDNSSNSRDINKIEVDVFPQPTTGILKLPELYTDNWDLRLFDSGGRQVVILKSSSIDISHLEPGIYFLQGKSQRQRFTERIIKI